MHVAPFAIANVCERRGRTVLYLTAETGSTGVWTNYVVTNWPGTLRLPVRYSKHGRHNIRDPVMTFGSHSRAQRGMVFVMATTPNYATVANCGRIIRYGFNFAPGLGPASSLAPPLPLAADPAASLAAGSRSRAWTRCASSGRSLPGPAPGLGPARRSLPVTRCRSLAAGSRSGWTARRSLRRCRSLAAGRSLPGPAPGLGPARRSLPGPAAGHSLSVTRCRVPLQGLDPLAARCRSLAAGRSLPGPAPGLGPARRSLPDPAAGRSLPGPAPGLGPARRSLPIARRSPLAAGSRCRSL